MRHKLFNMTDLDKRALKRELGKETLSGKRAGSLPRSKARRERQLEEDWEKEQEELGKMAREMSELTHLREIMLLEGIYVKLLGPAFRYRVGIHGASTDLFFINVLSNREKLALEMWKQVNTTPASAP